MSEKTLKERLDNLKNQQEQAKELFVKCQGAIEVIEQLIEEDTKDEKNKKK
jgi:predicted DNA-binding protein|tara:strand:- start:1031 stop:1183 length:153 start_codon:yes stop_codon:yes gene_type:complete